MTCTYIYSVCLLVYACACFEMQKLVYVRVHMYECVCLANVHMPVRVTENIYVDTDSCVTYICKFLCIICTCLCVCALRGLCIYVSTSTHGCAHGCIATMCTCAGACMYLRASVYKYMLCVCTCVCTSALAYFACCAHMCSCVTVVCMLAFVCLCIYR
jgi:hypothetical protein